MGEERAEDGRHSHGHDDRRDEAGEAADYEPGVVETSVALELAFERKRREIAGEHEEDGDAEEAPGKPRGVGVVEQDGDDGEGADALQGADTSPGPARLATSRGLDGAAVGPVARARRTLGSRTVDSMIQGVHHILKSCQVSPL